MPAPTATGRVRSTTDTLSLPLAAIAHCSVVAAGQLARRRPFESRARGERSRHWRRPALLGATWRYLALLGDAAFEAFGDHLAGQVAADEDDAAVALLAGLPWPLMIAV